MATNNTDDNNLETFSLLWLDAAIHTNTENQEAQKQLRACINHVIPFEDPNRCQRYIQTTSSQDRLVLIVSGRLGREVVPLIHQIRQLSSVYVYCMDEEGNKKWAKDFKKKKRVKEEDPIVINIYTVGDNLDQSTTGVNGGVVYSLLLIDVLLRMKPMKGEKRELIEFCRKIYKGNETQLAIIDEFEAEYSPKSALWWYTRESFIYKILNRALRVQNIDVIFLFRFVIRDIYDKLERHHCQLSIHVYRGQVLSNDELKNLRSSIGSFLSINSFFSTTSNRQQAMQFILGSDVTSDLYRVLFVIDADPSASTAKPFADISSHSEFGHESEVLFMIGSIFRIKSIRKIDDQIWRIHMIWCDENEHDLISLFNYMKKRYGGGDNETDLLKFGRVLRQMGKFDLAEKFYRRLLIELSSNDPLLSDLYYSLGLVLKDQKKLDSSLEYLHKSLELEVRRRPQIDRSLVQRYNAIGNIHREKNEHDIALLWYNKGIALLEKNNERDDETMAHFYHNTALIYNEQEKYEQALKLNHKALTTWKKCLPPNHSDIGLSYNNIGNIHRHMGNYDCALEHLHKSLTIREQSLPPDHPHIAQSYQNIGTVYEDMSNFARALEYFEKAVAIRRKLGNNDDVVRIENIIRRIRPKLK
ncbi:unnamed protein product [Adineta ricciae]|uniref:Uncharacterized protein n=2 Tax=Adineta ricciae TaxID=249248 RepID=A0A814Y3G6_ADIRI|nr:unnamed protein product [Adineta ricciae]